MGLAEFLHNSRLLTPQQIDAATSGITSRKLVRQGAIEISGRKVECDVVELAGDEMVLPRGAGTLNGFHSVAWVDKQYKLPMKLVVDGETKIDRPGKVHLEMTLTSLDLAPVFSKQEFKFAPPEGARLVERFSSFSK